jgi:hypothetical protein
MLSEVVTRLSSSCILLVAQENNVTDNTIISNIDIGMEALFLSVLKTSVSL